MASVPPPPSSSSSGSSSIGGPGGPAATTGSSAMVSNMMNLLAARSSLGLSSSTAPFGSAAINTGVTAAGSTSSAGGQQPSSISVAPSPRSVTLAAAGAPSHSPSSPPPFMRAPSLGVQCADESMNKYVRQHLLCPICISMVYEPMQTSCSHLFCAACIRPALQHKNQCPNCRTNFTAGKEPQPLAIANPAFYRFISDIEVKCHLNAINGCTWTGSFSEMDTHTKKRCEYTPIDCEYCNTPHPRGRMAAHHTECNRRPVKCTDCNQDVPYVNMMDHTTNICEATIVTCSSFTLSSTDGEVKGCSASMKRSELANHQKNICSQTIITCAYADLGCSQTRFPRHRLADHDQTNTLLHMRLMAKLVGEVSDLRKQVNSGTVIQPTKVATAATVAVPVTPPQIYVFGGHCGDKKVVHTAERWTAGKWEALPPMPTARKLVQAARVNDFIYVCGGDDTQGADMDVVEKLHVPTLTWFPNPPLPSARSCHCIASAGRSVFSLGGHVDQHPGSNLVDEYVEGATSWVSAPPMLNGRMYATSCSFDNKIYMFGGSPSLQVSAASPLSEVFDAATRRWTAIAAMPRARANARAVVVDGRILLVGGGTPSADAKSNDITDTIDEYNPANNSWRTLPIRMAAPRAGFAICYHSSSQSLIIAMGEPTSQASTCHVRLLPLIPSGPGPNNSGWGMAPTATQGRLSFAWVASTSS